MRSGSQGMMGRGMPFSPWELVRRMSDELGQLVTSMEPMRPGAARRSESLAPTLSSPGATLADLADESAIAWVPQIEVQQRPNELVVRADLPGVTPDLVEVSVDDGLLTISGERQQEEREERDGFIRTERVYGAFSRTIPLPDGADEDHVTAAFRDGVLEIIVPVTASERGRRVPVDREQGGSSGR
jgi:HSP20 family protein